MKILQISFREDAEYLEEFLESEGFYLDEDHHFFSVPVDRLICSELPERWEERRKGSFAYPLRA